MPFEYTCLIVGAGPAGCAAAFDLATAGHRVLLLDKRSFPRHKACACGLTRKTLKALRYSVDPVLERECRDVVLQEAGPAFLTGGRTADKSREVRVRLRNPFCAMAVRERFDAFCLQQTLARGPAHARPELRKIESILSLREFPDHIELEVALPGGATEVLRAPVLIGADGSNGQTRRLAAGIATPHPEAPQTPGAPSSPAASPPVRVGSEAPQNPQETTTRNIPQATAASLPPEPAWYARGFALEATVPYTALPATLPGGDGPLDLVFDFSPIAGGYGWLFPKGDHINIGVGGFVPQSPTNNTATNPAAGDSAMRYETVTRTLLADYTRAKLGVDLQTVTTAHITGQHLGLGGHAYTPEGRILLAGDAAGLVDPLTGEGIHSALVSGQAAAAAILEVLPRVPTGLSSRPDPELVEGEVERPLHFSAEATNLAQAYARHLTPLLETLTFSHRAARSFYREPERGFKVMRTPLLRSLVLKTYADGLPTTKLLAKLARRVA